MNNTTYLQQRGVTKAAQMMDIQPARYYDGTPGLAIPVQDEGGARVRFRAFDQTTDGHKTKWFGQRNSYTPKYYYHHQIAAHIRDHDGHLIIAAGEFDLLTFIQVSHCNVIAFASENSIPRDLAEQCRAWGVQTVSYWPDNDAAGLKSARRIHDTLTEAGIAVNAFDLSELVGPGGDTNDLWQALAFDETCFLDALNACPLANLPAPPQKKTTPSSNWRDFINDDFPPDFVAEVVRVLEGQPGYKKVGDNIMCSSPLRQDETPSFSFSLEKLCWLDFGTGDSGGIVALGQQLGIDIRDYQPRRWTPEPSRPDLSAPVIPDQPIDFTPDTIATARYCSDLDLSAATLTIRSPLNTGKTEAIIRTIKARRLPRVLFVTHLQSLTENLVKRLRTSGLNFELYKEARNPYSTGLGGVDKLVCTLDSLHKLKDARPYDLIVFDEAEQGIRHLWGGTMDGQAAAEAYTVLCDLTRRAGQVILLDAHMTDQTADWLAGLRGNVHRLHNAYRHDWGDLTGYFNEAALIDRAEAVTRQDQGPVVITTSSRKAARVFHAHFARLYGDRVRSVHGWNSQHKSNRDFIAHLDERLAGLRVLITSPSVGTGVDIQTPVAGVFGHFPGIHLKPTDMLQQMARFRNADERGVFIPLAERNGLLTDPAALLARERYRVSHTARLADFHRHGITAASPVQGEITRLWAAFQAASNRQLVHAALSFYALAQAEGFTLEFDNHEAPATTKALKQSRQALQAADDMLRLTLDPLDRDELDDRRERGIIQERDYLAFDRWCIENITGQRIDPELLDDYRTRNQRLSLIRFTDFTVGEKVSQQRDRDQAHELPFKRTHHAAAQRLFRGMVQAVFGKIGLDSTEQIPAAELEARLTDFIDEHREDIRQYLDGGREDYSSGIIATFRRVLRRFGLTLAYKVGGRDEQGRRRMVYWLDGDRLAVMRERAAIRQAMLVANVVESPDYSQDYYQPAGQVVLDRPKPPENPSDPPAWMAEIEF